MLKTVCSRLVSSLNAIRHIDAFVILMVWRSCGSEIMAMQFVKCWKNYQLYLGLFCLFVFYFWDFVGFFFTLAIVSI